MQGQMFILSMVFLVGLMVAVQSNLGQYSFVNLANTFREHPGPLLSSLSQDIQETLRFSSDCEDARTRMQQLESLWEAQHVGGTSIDLSWTLNCDNWDTTPLQATIRLTSIEGETRTTLVLGR